MTSPATPVTSPSSDLRGTSGAAPGQPVRSVRLSRRRLLVDGAPTLSFAGEVHYFRLDRDEWADRLDRLAVAGCDQVATYVPWIWHELPDGSVDLTGRTDERRDLAHFLDLAAERGLGVIARPGPFVMAELKNEGVPHRVYDDSPEVWPTTWEGRRITTRTADYLAPAFLAACEGWYAAVMPLLAERQWSRGGPVTSVQLDNEVGMLSWVTNSPDLTDGVCEDHRAWARRRYGDDVASRRTGADATDADAWAARLRRPEPGDDGALPLHHDLGLYMRDRFRRYVGHLRGVAERHGVTDVPFLVNVHGTGQGRGRTFPVGISQLFESYRGLGQITSGSDHYLGDLTVASVGDLYTMNAFMAAVHDDDQPLTSLEFEAGSGDYGEDMSVLVPPEAVELKTRLCVAQGNRLVSYYLFTGGTNPPLATPVGDGNDRIAFTGERHGFAAPIDPEGRDNPTYATTRRVVTALRGMGPLLADMDEEHDGLALGFVPDHYLTEYAHPSSLARTEQVADLERFRGMGPRDVLARALLLAGTSYPAVDLQAGPLDPATTPALALASASTLAADVQQWLVDYVRAGGSLLLHGVLPSRDHDGAPCTVLADGLGLAIAGRVDDRGIHYYPSVVSHDWAAPRAEVRVGYAQLLDAAAAEDARVLLTEKQTGEVCGVQVAAGAGAAVVVACDFPCHLDFWRAALTALGVERRLDVASTAAGVVATSTVDGRGQRLVHLVHVGPSPTTVSLTHRGTRYLGGRELHLPARTGVVLPAGVDVPGGSLVESSCEIVALDGDRLVLRPTQPDGDVVVLRTTATVRVTLSEAAADGSGPSGAGVTRDGDLTTVSVPAGTDRVTLTFS